MLRHCSSSKPETAANCETVLRTTDRRRGSLAILIRNFRGPFACGVAGRSRSLPVSRLIPAPIDDWGCGYHTYFVATGQPDHLAAVYGNTSGGDRPVNSATVYLSSLERPPPLKSISATRLLDLSGTKSFVQEDNSG